MSVNPNSSFPDYYLYKKDDKWFKTDANLTKQISAHIRGLKAVQIPKMTFYPNWNNEGVPGAKYAAWRVNEDGDVVARWYWKVRDHDKKTCRNCKRLPDGRCAIRVIAMIEWNKAGNCWSLAKMPDKASESDEKILDKE